MAKKSVKVNEDLIRGYMAGREPNVIPKVEDGVVGILEETITTEEEPIEEIVREKPKPRKKRGGKQLSAKVLGEYTHVRTYSGVSKPSVIRPDKELFARDCSGYQHCQLYQQHYSGAYGT